MGKFGTNVVLRAGSKNPSWTEDVNSLALIQHLKSASLDNPHELVRVSQTCPRIAKTHFRLSNTVPEIEKQFRKLLVDFYGVTSLKSLADATLITTLEPEQKAIFDGVLKTLE